MAILTDKGVEKTTLFEYQQLLQVAYKDAIGSTISVIPQSPIGQQIGIDALTASRIDDEIINVIQQLNVLSASGIQLDNYASTFSLPPRTSTNSNVFAEVFGTPGTNLPAGTLAETTNGDLFAASQSITIGSGSSTLGQFVAVESGPVAIAANTLTKIVVNIPGWDSINNSQDGIVGENAATDTEFRRLYFERLGQNALGTLAALLAAVSEVTHVISVKIWENDTSGDITLQNVLLLPHSIAVIVQGGNSQDIANAIVKKKSSGVGTRGDNTSLQIEVTQPPPLPPIFYYPVVFINIEMVVTIKQFVDVPDVESKIQTNIIDYFAGTFDVTIPAIGISDTLYKSRLYTPINAVRGFEVVSLFVAIEGGLDSDVITPDLNQRLITSAGLINVVAVP